MLANNIYDREILLLLEARRIEHILEDLIASSTATSTATSSGATSDATPTALLRYYSQLLMVQRMQRSELEADLYKRAIAQDGLYLLDGVYHVLLFNDLMLIHIVDDEESDVDFDEAPIIQGCTSDSDTSSDSN